MFLMALYIYMKNNTKNVIQVSVRNIQNQRELLSVGSKSARNGSPLLY
jgi:hypothetical protein